LWNWVDHLGGIVFRASVSAAVLSSLLVLAMLGCRQPARRIALARAAILGALVLIPLVGLAPLPRFDLVGALQGMGVLPHPLLSPSPGWGWPGRAGPWPGPARVVFGLYLAGVGACLAELFVGYWALGWLIRHSRAPSPRVQALYDAIAYSGRRPRPRLRVSTRFPRPVLLGTFRPTILIPPALDAEEPDTEADADTNEALRLSLLHELAHAERSDTWFCLLGSLSQAFWFFLPPLWWIRNQMRLDHEFLADRHAAFGFGAAETYASSLLAIAASDSEPLISGPAPDSPPPRPAGTDRSPLLQRILMLVACPFRVERRPPAWWRWSLSIMILLLTPLVACLCLDLGATGLPATSPDPQTRTHPQTFRLARLTIAPQNPGPLGRAPAFELPLRLPQEFDLVLEVWGDPATLARSRVAGHRLGPADAASTSETPREPETWHVVQLKRTPRGLSVCIDGHPVPTDPRTDRITSRLSVEPAPGGFAQFRNLQVTW
jgi:hypothetical protein